MVANEQGSSLALGQQSGVRLPLPDASQTSKRNRPRWSHGTGWYALVFLLPSLVLVGLIFIYPVYSLVRMSLYQSLGSLSLYVGLDNYRVALNDPLFLISVRNNLVLMV